MRFFLIWTLILFPLWSSSLTDAAYKAYKEKQYNKALTLYTKASKHGSHRQQIKAYYNLGVFYKKGIGTAKDPKKALKNFRMAALVGQGIIHTMGNTYYNDDTLRIMRDTYRYLSRLEKSDDKRKKAKQNATRIETKIKERIAAKKEAQQEAKYKKREQQKRIATYLRKCPASRIIPTTYRNDIDQINCQYFKHYPELMRKYMPLRAKYKVYAESYESIKLEKVNNKIQKILNPILVSLQKKRISCYEKALLRGDLMTCDGNYLSELDSLLMTSSLTNYNDSITQFGSSEAIAQLKKENLKHLTTEEKKNAVSKLKNGAVLFSW